MPTSSTAATLASADHPASSVRAAIIVESATTEPTDRSIPPVRITNVMPTASTIRNALSTNRFSTTCGEAKPS